MTTKQDRAYILNLAKEHNIKFIRLWFTDILGVLKSVAITVEELESAIEEGAGFDGSSIEGFARIDESDMVAMPDPNTFVILPWRQKENFSVARMFCDIMTPDGKHYECDPRWVLKKVLKRAADMGYTCYVGPELEYYYFKSSASPEPLDFGGYFDLTPLDEAQDLRRDTVIALEQLGIGVEQSHHEVGPSQHEIDLRYTDALAMADAATTYRLVVKEVALQNGCHATFMPKPLFGEAGSGMHVHQSLFKGERNAFFDPKDKPYHLSTIGRQYIAGLLKHASEITLICNQWVNSYKRLVPGYEAPVYISWALRNRADLVRIPAYKPGKENATRVEFRSPDPACNLYLAFAVMIAAGLEGIEKKYKLQAPVEENIYEMSEAERRKRGIGSLPGTLREAINAAESSDLLRRTLGSTLLDKVIQNKRIEWDRYRVQVHQYELKEYLPRL